jgi:hypothetical protein
VLRQLLASGSDAQRQPPTLAASLVVLSGLDAGCWMLDAGLVPLLAWLLLLVQLRLPPASPRHVEGGLESGIIARFIAGLHPLPHLYLCLPAPLQNG